MLKLSVAILIWENFPLVYNDNTSKQSPKDHFSYFPVSSALFYLNIQILAKLIG